VWKLSHWSIHHGLSTRSLFPLGALSKRRVQSMAVEFCCNHSCSYSTLS
jgi:hypothetical protein